MIELRQSWLAVQGWRRIPVLLLGAFLLQACSVTPSGVHEGALFQAQEEAPAGKALVYAYWSPEESREEGSLDHFWLMPRGQGLQEVRRGGYAVLTLEPGQHYVHAQRQYDITSSSSVGMDMGEVVVEARAGETYFVRIEETPRFPQPRVELRPVEAAAALPEIRKCREMVGNPLQIDAAGNVISGG